MLFFLQIGYCFFIGYTLATYLYPDEDTSFSFLWLAVIFVGVLDIPIGIMREGSWAAYYRAGAGIPVIIENYIWAVAGGILFFIEQIGVFFLHNYKDDD